MLKFCYLICCAFYTSFQKIQAESVAGVILSAMKILVSGSHGLVGKSLTHSLTDDGHEVVRLVRHEHNFGSPEVEWYPDQGRIDAAHLEGIEAVIHLAGDNIASGRWTAQKKRIIRESRTKGTALLSETLASLSHLPSVFISASAIGFYGNRGDEVLTEQSPPGKDFLAHVCVDWEAATSAAKEKGIRTTHARFGVILDAHEGALAKMLPPFRAGLGGKVGGGNQWMSWIALADVVAALKFLLEDRTIQGPVNVVSPNPVTNAEFTKTLARVLSRPAIFPLPAFAARLAFGEMADALLLASQRVDPAVLEDNGFLFTWPTLEPALRNILHTD